MNNSIFYRFRLQPKAGSARRSLKQVGARVRQWYRERLEEFPVDDFSVLLETAAGGLGQPRIGQPIRGGDGSCFIEFEIKADGDLQWLGRLSHHVISQLHARQHSALARMLRQHGYELLSRSQRDSSRWTINPDDVVIRLIGHSNQHETTVDLETGSFSAYGGRMVETAMHNAEHPEYASFIASESSIEGEAGQALLPERGEESESGQTERSRFFRSLDLAFRNYLAEFFRSGRCDCPVCLDDPIRPESGLHRETASRLSTELQRQGFAPAEFQIAWRRFPAGWRIVHQCSQTGNVQVGWLEGAPKISESQIRHAISQLFVGDCPACERATLQQDNTSGLAQLLCQCCGAMFRPAALRRFNRPTVPEATFKPNLSTPA